MAWAIFSMLFLAIGGVVYGAAALIWFALTILANWLMFMKAGEAGWKSIIPVYNTEKYIEKCLDSVLDAMDTDCEVIIVNDGATDNSEKIIKQFINDLPEKYKENFVYTKKKNKGLADTKNVGIEMARGKFISVVDSDDYIDKNFYKIAREYINNYDVIIYDLYVVFEKNPIYNYTSRAYREDKENFLEGLLDGAMSGSSCNKIIKKELYNDFKFPVGKQYEDVAVTPFILTNAKNIKYMPYPFYYYLQREKSIVATNTYVSAFYKICENISEVIRKQNNEFEKYKYIVNEFITIRILEIFNEDFNKNKEKFVSNLEDFEKKNKNTINYILESNMLYSLNNGYSERQKKLLQDIFKALSEGNCGKVKEILTKRKIVNYFRNILMSTKTLLKSIVNR